MENCKDISCAECFRLGDSVPDWPQRKTCKKLHDYLISTWENEGGTTQDLPSQCLKCEFDQLANNFIESKKRLEELCPLLTDQIDRRCVKNIMTDLTWASENATVLTTEFPLSVCKGLPSETRQRINS